MGTSEVDIWISEVDEGMSVVDMGIPVPESSGDHRVGQVVVGQVLGPAANDQHKGQGPSSHPLCDDP